MINHQNSNPDEFTGKIDQTFKWELWPSVFVSKIPTVEDKGIL